MPTFFPNPCVQRFNSKYYWANGQQRTLTHNGEADPYQPQVSISHGAYRKLFIDGYGRAWHSGDRSRVNFLVNSYSQEISLFTEWKSTITSLRLTLRSRIDEINPTTNRFGGYIVDIYNNRVEWFRLNYKGTPATALNPASHLFDPLPNLADGERIGIKFSVTDNIPLHTQSELIVRIARPINMYGYRPVGISFDTAPQAQMLDAPLYNAKSFASIKLNGTAKDVKYDNIRFYNLGDMYRYELKGLTGTTIKETGLRFQLGDPL